MYSEKYIDLVFTEEAEILNEIHFSKKDLQDPKSIEKCLNMPRVFDSIHKAIRFIVFAFTLLLAIPTLGTIFIPMKSDLIDY